MKKIIIATAAAAVAVTPFAGTDLTALAAESTAITGLTGVVENGQVKLEWSNNGDSASKIYRNGTLISNLQPTATLFQDSLLNAKLQMPNMPKNIEVTDSANDLNGEKQIEVAFDATKLATTETLTYVVEDKSANSATVAVDVHIAPTKLFYLINDKSTVTEAELTEEFKDGKVVIPQTQLMNGYLHIYAIDENTGTKSPVKSYALVNNYEGGSLPDLADSKPTIIADTSTTAKEVNITVTVPDAFKNQGAIIEYRTAYGQWQTYGGPIKVTENTYVEARIKDAHGNVSKVAALNVTNINADFGSEFETILDKNVMTIKLKDGVTNIDRIEYSINDSAWAMYTAPVKVADGDHKVSVRAVAKDGSVSPVKSFDWKVNSKGDTTEADKDSAYKELFKKATDLVVVAESSKTQEDIDKARKSFEGLSAADKLILEGRLEVVQDYVNTTQASKYLSTLKNSKTVDNLVNALVSIGQLKSGTVRTELEKEVLGLVSEVIKGSSASQIDKAVEKLVSDAETKAHEGHVFAIEQLLKHVSDAGLKAQLEKDFKEISALVKHKEDFKKAEEALKKAETTETTKNFEEAKKLVTALPESDLKAKMMKRLDRLSAILGVISNDVINDILAGKEVPLSKLAGFLKMEIPSSLESVIYGYIKALDDDASEATVRATVELAISYDLAVRAMSAKTINEYTKTWNSHATLPTINKFPSSATLISIFKFMEDDAQLDSVIKHVANEVGVTETALKNYFSTVAPSVVKGSSGTNLIPFEDLAKFEKNYSFMAAKAIILTKQALMSKQDVDNKAGIAYVKTLLNGEFKQTLLSSLGVTGEELKNAGIREDKMVSGDATETEKPEELPEGSVDPESDLGKLLAEQKEAIHLTQKDVKAGDKIKLSGDGFNFEFEAPTDASRYDIVIYEHDNGDITITIFLDGKELQLIENSVKVTMDMDGKTHVLKYNQDGDAVPVNHRVTRKSLELNMYGKITLTVSDIDPSFTDISGNYAEKYILELTQRGIIENGSKYDLHAGMTRGEFAAILASALELESPDDSSPFPDSEHHEYSDSINALYMAGVVQGVPGGNFEPDREVTRQQAALMLSRAMEHLGIDTPSSSPTFVDTNKISPNAIDAVGSLQKMGIFEGKPGGVFDPYAKLTKGQTAKIIHIGLQKMGII